jgi:hypothetical protein
MSVKNLNPEQAEAIIDELRQLNTVLTLKLGTIEGMTLGQVVMFINRRIKDYEEKQAKLAAERESAHIHTDKQH